MYMYIVFARQNSDLLLEMTHSLQEPHTHAHIVAIFMAQESHGEGAGHPDSQRDPAA